MAYQLQPGMNLVENPARPPVCANEEVFVYPQPSTLNYSSGRPNTMLYGTAPYMAGKGSPAQYIETSDQYEQGLFPLQDMKCKLPLRTMTYEPESTRADTQNHMFVTRYPSQ